MDCSTPGSSVPGILQASILKWVAMPSSRESSQPRDWTCVPLYFLHWQQGSLPLTPPGKPSTNYIWYYLVAQTVKCLPAMRETWVQSLGWENPLEKEKAAHSSTLAWKIPWTVSPWSRKESDMTERHLKTHEKSMYNHKINICKLTSFLTVCFIIFHSMSLLRKKCTLVKFDKHILKVI